MGGDLNRKTRLLPACDVTSHSTSARITVVPLKEGLAGLVGFSLMFTILEKNIQNSLEPVSLDSALDLILKMKKSMKCIIL